MATMTERLLPMPEMLPSTLDYFWVRVNIFSESECWNWCGSINSSGYGCVCIYNKHYLAHRVSYYIHHKDPGEFLVCHECNNKLCVNPNHLFLGTHQNNNQHAFDTGIRSHVGILSPNAKLTEENIREIRELCNTMSQRRVAKLFNVSHTTIGHIMLGKHWSHII